MQLLTATICLLLLLSSTGLGCSRAGAPVKTREGQSNPNFAIVITEGPEANSSIEDGVLRLKGHLTTDLGCSALTLDVLDVATGLWSPEADVIALSGWNAAVSYDPQTFQFVIGEAEAENPPVLVEGEKIVRLTAEDLAGQPTEWTIRIFSPPTYTPTLTAIRDARAAWGTQLTDLLKSNVELIGQLVFDGTAFPFAETDIAGAALMADRIGTILSDPTTASWTAEAAALAADLSELFNDSGLAAAEPAYCEGVLNSISWWSLMAQHTQAWNAGIMNVGWGYSDMDSMEQQRTGLLTYLLHTYMQAGYTTGTYEGNRAWARWEARLWQDEGAPHMLNCDTYVLNSVQPNTGDPDNPVWQLVILFEDTDGDGAMDVVTAEGLTDNADPDGPIEPFTDSTSYGHLITYLQYVFGTRYIGVAGY